MLEKLVSQMMSPEKKAALVQKVMVDWAEKFGEELGCPPHEVRLLIYVGENGVPAGQLYHKGKKVRDVTLKEFVS